MQYRPEIDGLRSLAILPVLFFHADLPGFVRGHLGVDIFFVISGYLIAGLILQDARQGNFCIRDFYIRRARRLLPALFFVILFSGLCAWWSLFPADMLDFSRSVLTALTFTSNFYFWKTGDYFATESSLRPLLHLWSLGIEEQFYLIFPWLFVWRNGRLTHGSGGVWLLVAALASLLLACWWGVRSPSAAFYLPFTRAWELLVGAAVAWHGWGGRVRSRGHSVSAWLGLVLVLVVLVCPYSLPWPVLTVTLPLVVGTALVLAYARGTCGVARVLSWRPLVLLGLLSYSAYLWHQPIFAFARHNLLMPQGWGAVVGVVVVLALAWCSWRWVEQPFRGKTSRVSDRLLVQGGAGVAVVLALCVSVVLLRQGVPSRYSSLELGMVTYAQDNFQRFTQGYRVGACFLDEHTAVPVFDEACRLRTGRDEAVWGDSHAAALYQGLASLPQTKELWAQYTGSGCPPLLDFEVTWRPFCRAMNDEILEQVRRGQPKLLVLHANWLLYEEQGLEAALENTVRRVLQVTPRSQIVVLGGVPQWQPSLPMHLVRRGIHWQEPKMAWLENRALDSVRAVDQKLSAVVERVVATSSSTNLEFISALDLLCAGKKCPVTAELDGEWMPFFWDYGHLTTAAARWFAGKLQLELERHAEE